MGLAALLGGALVCGCALPTRERLALQGKTYAPANVFREPGPLPPDLKRVAVLPVTLAEATPATEGGRDGQQTVLLQELTKTGRFEVLAVTPSQLQRWTGQPGWTPSDRLPANFFERLRESTGADGVLFCHLTHYRPYPPLAVGWRLQLVAAAAPRILWSVDELVDASDETVARGAQRYQLAHQPDAAGSDSGASVLQSPSRFGRYVAATLAGTLPER